MCGVGVEVRETFRMKLLLALFFISCQRLMASTPKSHHSHPKSHQSIHPKSDEFSNCTSIFLDLGANIGVQGRRLYEMEKFPRRGILNDLFDKHFGKTAEERLNVCTFAFEPNPRHTPRLREMEAIYQSLGIRYYFYPYAVSTVDTTFQLSRPTNTQTQVAASLVKPSVPSINATNLVTVQVLNLIQFFHKYFEKNRKIQSFLCKMDIEGEEYNLLPSLISSGLICHIDSLFVEYHYSKNPSFKSGFLQTAERKEILDFQWNISTYIDRLCPTKPCKTDVIWGDDELYKHDNLRANPFPLFRGADEECKNVKKMCVLSEPIAGMTPQQYQETIFGIKNWVH
jgi:FkbM family methyltransferase